MSAILRRDKPAMQAFAAYAAGSPASTRLHHLADIGLRHLQSRNQPEEYRAQQRQPCREEQYWHIDANGHIRRNMPLGIHATSSCSS